mmetsp:Transcript_123545/g.357233  ORF Transcript_123545/g.357233 Transcript_123545/m.357233 type:complete len:166 (-) Transcript_123545:200-697(-)
MGCSRSKASGAQPSGEMSAPGARGALREGEVDLTGDGGILKKTVVEGDGPQPQRGQTVFVHYTGRLLDGTVFDSTADKPHRKDFGFYFTIGAGEVIRGWDIGFSKMHVHEKAMLTCRADYAYGSRTAGDIPPNATLEFEVELLDARTLGPKERQDIDAKVAALRR